MALKIYKALLHKHYEESIPKRNEELMKKYFDKKFPGVFYITLCLQDGYTGLKTEDNIQRTAQSFSSGEEVELIDLLHGSRVLLIGAPGTGKTTVAQAITYKWGARELWDERFDFVFYLECRRLNMSEGSVSLIDVILRHHPAKLEDHRVQDLVNHINAYPENILIVLDGLDELNGWPEEMDIHDDDRELVKDITHKVPIQRLIYSLIYGYLLKKAILLLTSRPIPTIEVMNMSRVMYALGFNEGAIDDCSFALCESDPSKHKKLGKELLEKKPHLYAFCVIPLNCVFICSFLLSGCTSIDSLTQLSIETVSQVLIRRVLDEKSRDEALLRLSRLAAKFFIEVEKPQLVFSGEDMTPFNLFEKELKNGVEALLEISQSSDAECDGVQASFIHLSIQEFLTAVHICLTWKESDVRRIATVDLKSRRLDNVQLYTAGLLGKSEKQKKFLMEINKIEDASYEEKAAEYFKIMINSDGRNEEIPTLVKLQIIRCVHEGRREEYTEEIYKAVTTVKGKQKELDLARMEGGILPYHLASIRYFLENSCSMNLNVDILK